MPEEQLLKVARLLVRAGSGHDLYRTLVTRTRRALGRGVGTSFFLVYRASDLVLPVAESSEKGRMHPEAYTQKITTGIVGEVVRSGKTHYSPDVSTDPLFHSAGQKGGSELVVPVMLEDEVIGIFNVESRRRNAFSPTVISRLELLCEATAVLMTSGVAQEQQRALEAQIESLKKAAAEFEGRFEALARALDEGVLVTDANGKIAFENGAWKGSFARHVGKPFESLISPDDQAKWERAEQKGSSVKLKMRLGRIYRTVFARTIPLVTTSESPSRLILLRAAPERTKR
ncbi:MAG: GAF domain-containing protein [Candidatus Brocadiae bacterium]|nr:GAF domain-containing protein [Candidatus Brocadiia bacterium]